MPTDPTKQDKALASSAKTIRAIGSWNRVTFALGTWLPTRTTQARRSMKAVRGKLR